MSNTRLDGPEGELEPSEIHNVLRNERRRRAIEHLAEHDGTLTVDDLAKHIASLETGEPDPPHDARKSVYVSLHQTHLPKLDELGIVDYDLRSKELELKDRAAEVEVYMDVVPRGTLAWDVYYVGVAALAIATLAAVKLDVDLVAALGFEFWSWFYVAVFAGSALFHLWDRRGNRLLP